MDKGGVIRKLVELTSDFAPGVGGVLSKLVVKAYEYDENKAEENLQQFLEYLKEYQKELGILLEEENYHQMKLKYINMIVRSVIYEKQPDKIKYFAKVTKYLIGLKEVQEDVYLSYIDILKELRMMDISILFMYGEIDKDLKNKKLELEKTDSPDNYGFRQNNPIDIFKEEHTKQVIDEYIKEAKVDESVVSYIRYKLQAKGLLQQQMGITGAGQDFEFDPNLTRYGEKLIEILGDKIYPF